MWLSACARIGPSLAAGSYDVRIQCTSDGDNAVIVNPASFNVIAQ